MFDNSRETWKCGVLGIGNVLTNSRHFDRKDQGRLYMIEGLSFLGEEGAAVFVGGGKEVRKLEERKFISRKLGFRRSV
jgi:hypothetical protein